jgi:hypothetical protein
MKCAALVLSLIATTACGSSSTNSGTDAPPGTGPTSPNAPRFLTFGTNVTSLTKDQSVTFTAVLTDPDGIDDLIGGSLMSLDEASQYGAFATTGQEGAYTMQLSWAAINQAAALTFHKTTTRSFRAVFYDVAGHRVSKDVMLSMTCPENACSGDCYDFCVEESTMRQSCEAVCAATNPKMNCQMEASSSLPRFCYDALCSTAKYSQSCTTVPTATYGSSPFNHVVCACIPQ